MSQYTVYARPGSGSLAVEVALEEIGVRYARVWVPGDPDAVAKYRAINPTGKVPALALPDGTLMFESAAILAHLELAHPCAGLAPPPGTAEHARFLQWLIFLAANAYEAVLRIYYSDRFSTGGEADAARIRDQATQDFRGHLALIAQSLNPYVLGGRYSIVDVYLYMLTGWYPGDKAELFAQLPSLGAHSEAIARRPSVAKVMADHAA